MGGLSALLKTVFVPLVAAALLYLVVTYALLPLHRRYVRKYQHYLPLSSLAPASLVPDPSAGSLRHRLSALFDAFRSPSYVPARIHAAHPVYGDDSDLDLTDGEGEGMIGFSPVDGPRREALERSGRGGHAGASERRLSRDLEEGFRDSSSDDEAPRANMLGRIR
ncbi:uncharacterized protein K452DRAFT_294747 [Aplosporella prunicola CBS 121167]|uniref:Uncharacterized protein n=1 Tax=Aplosporella prunicola CBS 121167 TaxID=1176127 RepID=A0A6A6BU35_9PEZI|nr:uncharacterized protein K452DRAFT_294747 [Aplosporella prunicola CBS 121167]KAF2146141.1 hypothetical protein K452DRAFT_294747 [Aplosporella prunicola CBS 121167]